MSSTPDEQDAANETEVRIRRAPKYGPFIIVGGGIGAIVTFILTALFPVDPNVGFGALFGYFALYGVTGGALVGAIFALVFDRVLLRRSRPATVVTEITDPDLVEAERLRDEKWAAEDAAADAAANPAPAPEPGPAEAPAKPHEDPTLPDVPKVI
jgi:pimeloyl-ACP methyl ester carboxylesterase